MIDLERELENEEMECESCGGSGGWDKSSDCEVWDDWDDCPECLGTGVMDSLREDKKL